MPSGRVHSAATVGLSVMLLAYDPVMACGSMAGLILSPDLDVDDGCIAFAHIRRIPVIGMALSTIWRIYWYPYAKLAPHRSPISHAIIFSTLLRVAYVLLPLIIANFCGVEMFIPDWLGRAIIGLIFADGLHVIMDSIWSWRSQ